jgi:hypothetical protein
MEKSAQPGGGEGGLHAHPFHYFYHHIVQNYGKLGTLLSAAVLYLLRLYFGVKIVDNYRHIGTPIDGIFKFLRSPGIDSEESIPPALVA